MDPLYRVSLSKAYFPSDLWPGDIGNTTVHTVVVRAATRTAAARKVWERIGETWLARMLPHVRRVSLYVSAPYATGPRSHCRSLAGRMEPIEVMARVEARTSQPEGDHR